MEQAGGRRRIGLVGCVKEKDTRRRRAKDLYLSTLFAGRRSYVERSCGEWWVLSAKYGLVHPDEEIDTYDVALKNAGRDARREWSRRVLASIDQRVRPAAGQVFEMHAGSEYRDFGVEKGLKARGCVIENPTEGMRFGEQLQFYMQARRGRP